MNEALEQKLSALHLGRVRQIYSSWIEQAATSNLGYAEFLDQLLEGCAVGPARASTATQDESRWLSLPGDD